MECLAKLVQLGRISCFKTFKVLLLYQTLHCGFVAPGRLRGVKLWRHFEILCNFLNRMVSHRRAVQEGG